MHVDPELAREGILIASQGLFRYYSTLASQSLFPLRKGTQLTFSEAEIVARIFDAGYWDNRLVRVLIIYLAGQPERLDSLRVSQAKLMVDKLGKDFLRDLNRLRLLHSM